MNNQLIEFQDVWINFSKVTCVCPIVEPNNNNNEIHFKIVFDNGEFLETEKVVLPDYQTFDFLENQKAYLDKHLSNKEIGE